MRACVWVALRPPSHISLLCACACVPACQGHVWATNPGVHPDPSLGVCAGQAPGGAVRPKGGQRQRRGRPGGRSGGPPARGRRPGRLLGNLPAHPAAVVFWV